MMTRFILEEGGSCVAAAVAVEMLAGVIVGDVVNVTVGGNIAVGVSVSTGINMGRLTTGGCCSPQRFGMDPHPCSNRDAAINATRKKFETYFMIT
jgi:hypothetical protein